MDETSPPNSAHSAASEQRVAIVTGASSGIGAGVAEALAARGLRVVLSGRRAEALDTVVERIGADHALALAGELTLPDTPQRLVDAACERWGRCDIVFNGAGVMHAPTIEDADLEVLSAMIHVNVEAATRMAYVALRHFRQLGSGHLINVSSILGTKVRPTTGVYAGSKYFIEALSEALRMEVAGSDIQVSVIEPGVTQSGLQDHFPIHPKQSLGIDQPLSAGDIAEAVWFLLTRPRHVRIPVMMVLPGQQAM